MIKGTLGKTFIVNDLPKNSVLVSSNLAIIRLKNSNFTSAWLNIYLQSILAKYYIQQVTTGTAITTLPVSQLKKSPILNLDLAKQNEIVHDYHQAQTYIQQLQEKLKLAQENQLQQLNSQMKINDIFSLD